MMRTMLLQRLDGITEIQPFTYADRQRTFTLHVFHNQEIFPSGIVLYRRKAVLNSVGECKRESATALRRRGRRDLGLHQILRTLPDNSSRLAVSIQINGPACRSFRFASDTRSFQCR